MPLPMGGKRPGSGRKAGTPNKTAAAVKAYAMQFSTEAIDGLISIARDDEAPKAARVSAWDKVLDRAIGKASQAVEISGGIEIGRIERVVVHPANTNTACLPAPAKAV